ncbi:MAG: NAD(P)H-binding protein [Gordonia sp. (in: high G+C Gram-positive bacteria)]|uniref:NAD(P)H-binding protein n=1 Tax=Gordonia sp. (in: high G+C Gram-positive bacteria) TaxID=84139 RepID=UPI003BB65883
METIAIIGGHGKVALELAPILTARGDSVTSLIRTAEQAIDVAATGASPLLLDIEQASVDELAVVLGDADAVVFSAGAGGGNPQRTHAVDRDAAIRAIQAAQSAGVRRFVMVSYLGAGPDHGVPEDHSFYAYAEAKAAADTALRASTLDWTILMPGSLTEDAATGAIDPTATATTGNPGTSRANVAQVAAAVLADRSTIGKDIPFTDGEIPIPDAVAR